MNISQKDKEIIRRLATQYAEIASLDIHKETIQNWKRLNSLKPVKPMVLIDQIPWHEMNINNELTLQCDNSFCRDLENKLRKTIYKWRHFPCDMVVMPYIEIPKAIDIPGYGIFTVYKDELDNAIHENAQTHLFEDQLPDEEALDKVKCPVISHNEKETASREAVAKELFGDIIPVKMVGTAPSFRLWDELTFFRGVTPILYDFADRPELIHATMDKFTNIKIDILKQCERLNIFEKDALTMHCSHTFTDELPQKGFDGVHVNGTDCWAYGMAQIFSSCSPDMFDEFEIEYAKKYYEHCGLVVYGCCEPLHDKVHLIRKMKNIRKISTSPWSDVYQMAKNIGSDYVLHKKPSPSFVAGSSVDEASIRKEISDTLKACTEYGTPCEFTLKDITTVEKQPERLTRWAQITYEEIEKWTK